MLTRSALFALLCIPFISLSQQSKILNMERISEVPRIDGILDDAVWESLQTYSDFNMYQPGNDGTVDPAYQTEVKMAYDDKAVYVAAFMKHPNPSAIPNQFSQRDDVDAQADVFMVALNTYNDGLNETRFYVTSAGTIGDSKVSQNNQDFGYNVVFECRISKDSRGWYAEYRIPYNALRFPEVDVQNWSVNFYRRLTNKNETHTWNFIENGVGRETQYNGKITGVKNINPPTRLTFFPFAQGVVGTFDGETSTDVSAGLDIKYGLSDSFTLDATLIPDFGQASFDKVTLNLGPFEQTFSENRQFFTEGVELFNKGGIFFSRRVGSAPTGSIGALADNEVVLENPNRVNLLNAIKVSGRTKDELGVGVFNAITEKTFAVINDTVSGVNREVLIEPLSNYNIIVLDQQFNGNSSISLINTSVLRNGSGFRDANTTGLVFDVADKGNNFRASGRSIVSNVNQGSGMVTGLRTELDLQKIKGNWQYRVGHDFANTTYDINDLGVNFTNNYNNFVAGGSYQIFEPHGIFNNYRISMTVRHRRLYKPSIQTRNSFDLNWFFATKTRFAFGGFVSYDTENKDYFEPRVEGRFVRYPANMGGNIWISSDYRKKFALDANVGTRQSFGETQPQYFFGASPRYRFSDKLLVVVSTDWSFRNNQFGYIDNNDVDIFFGQRDIRVIENEISASYNFDPFKAIDLQFRNFWTVADYSDNVFYTLNEDGTRTLATYDTESNDPNRNFDIWNLDLSFRWRFAPGSEATLLYRNQIFKQDEQSTLSYTESLGNLFQEPIQHTLSLRITYFLDYNNINSIWRKNS